MTASSSSDVEKQGNISGGATSGAVYEQLVQRVKALEDSLQQIGHPQMQRKAGGEQRSSPVSGPYSSLKAMATSSSNCYTFQMPTQYPRYTQADYMAMSESRLDRLLEEYGLPINVASSLAEKRRYAIGVFLWKSQIQT